jgi:hypothetical protein
MLVLRIARLALALAPNQLTWGPDVSVQEHESSAEYLILFSKNGWADGAASHEVRWTPVVDKSFGSGQLSHEFFPTTFRKYRYRRIVVCGKLHYASQFVGGQSLELRRGHEHFSQGTIWSCCRDSGFCP